MTRTITTAAELDALPFPSVVAFPGYGDWHKRRDGRWLCDDGDEVLTSGALALVANGELIVTGDPSAPAPAPVVPVVSDAAVEAFKRAWHRTDGEGRAGERVRDGLTAALPHLGATPYVVPEAVTRGLAQSIAGETEDLGDFTQYDATVPSATREEVRDEIAGHPIGSGYYATSVGVDEASEITDALLARFTITPRTDR